MTNMSSIKITVLQKENYSILINLLLDRKKKKRKKVLEIVKSLRLDHLHRIIYELCLSKALKISFFIFKPFFMSDSLALLELFLGHTSLQISIFLAQFANKLCISKHEIYISSQSHKSCYF